MSVSQDPGQAFSDPYEVGLIVSNASTYQPTIMDRKINSSNLSSYLKLNKIKRSLSLDDGSIFKDGEEPRKLSEPTENNRQAPPLRRKSKFSFSSTPRKLSLMSEQGDQIMVDLGNAIRSGSVQFVQQVLENNGCEILNKPEIQFETYFRRIPQTPMKYPRKINDFGSFVGVQDSITLTRQRLRAKDKMFATPFQLAIMAQQTEMVEILLNYIPDEKSMKLMLGTRTKVIFNRGPPDTYFKDDLMMDGVNAFHLAARFHPPSLLKTISYLCERKWLRTVTDLLEAVDPHLKKTPLHNACKSWSTLPVAVLLNCGVDLEAVDIRGYTALHMACKEGNDAICNILLENGADPNAYGGPKYFRTPLHRARTKKVVQSLLRFGANPFLPQNDLDSLEPKRTVFDCMIKRNPEIVTQIMDNAIYTNGQELDSTELTIIFDFELFFRQGLKVQDELKRQRGGLEFFEFTDNEHSHPTNDDNINSMNEMEAHGQMVQMGCPELLKHPLAEAYLHLKWKLISRMFYFNVALYAFFVLMFTAMNVIMSKMNQCDSDYQVMNCSKAGYNKLDTNNFGQVIQAFLESDESGAKELGQAFLVFYALTALGLLFLGLREAVQVLTTGLKTYLQSKENILELVIIVTTMLTLICLFISRNVAIHLAAWGLFFSWFDLTLMLGRFPTIGIFIYMAMNVVKTLAIFLFVYLPLLLAFTFTFHVLLPSNETFTDPLTSFLKVLSMMSGEFDLSDNFLMNPTMEDNAQGSTQLIFVCFLVVGNIVIANLLIGLTVSKTEEMFKSAGILKLQKTVELIIAVENMLGHAKDSNSSKGKGYFMTRFRKQIRLFLYLKKMLHSEGNETEFSKGDEQPSPWKISVMPHSSEQMISNGKGRAFLANPSFDSSSTTFDRGYISYLYDDLQMRSLKRLPFTIPAWIVGHALGILQDRKIAKDQDAQKENDMDNELFRESSTMLAQLGNLENDEYSQRKSKKISRKVSMATELGEIKEEALSPSSSTSQYKLSQEEILEEIASVQNQLDRLQQALQSLILRK